jgi:serpin B
MDFQNNADDVGSLVTAYNRFGFKLLAKLCEKNSERNVFISSAGIAFALALIHSGAGGDTQQAIARVLELQGASQQLINLSSQSLYEDLLSLDHEDQLAIASALWIAKEISFEESFLQIAKHFFRAEADTVDFGSPAAVETINRWVHQRTGGKITTLVERADLDAQTDCVLASAVYFKGRWAVPFTKEETRQGVFHLPQNRRKSVWFMRQWSKQGYFEQNAFQAVRLGYSDGRISSYIFLPAKQGSLAELVKGLEVETWNGWLKEFAERQVEIIMPRFKMIYEAELRETLGQLGMSVALNTGADFAPMGLAGRYIGKIKHKSMAEVNEEGTEAAATTAIMMTRSLFAPPRINVERPFFWAIQDNRTNLVLFLGAIFDPDN